MKTLYFRTNQNIQETVSYLQDIASKLYNSKKLEIITYNQLGNIVLILNNSNGIYKNLTTNKIMEFLY